MFGGIYELVTGVIINNHVWIITDPDGSTRNVNAGTKGGWITSVAAESGPFFDIIPILVDGSETTYYSDYYYTNTNEDVVLSRSCSSTYTQGGVACTGANVLKVTTNAHYGSRLAFRGELTESKDVTSYKSITAV